MDTLDVRPKIVDVFGYAGDTLTVGVIAPESLVAGKQWDAQVRLTPNDTEVQATFEIVPPVSPGGIATVTLPSEVTRALAQAGTTVMKKKIGTRSINVQVFEGVWDCQVSNAGDDPIRTLVRGAVMIELDITRAGA